MAIDEREIRVNQISLIASFGLWWKNTRSRIWNIAGGFFSSDYDRGDDDRDGARGDDRGDDRCDDDRGDTDDDNSNELEC